MQLPNVQDTLESAKHNNIIPDQEFLLQGRMNIFDDYIYKYNKSNIYDTND